MQVSQKSIFSNCLKYLNIKLLNVKIEIKDLGQSPIQSAQILAACG